MKLTFESESDELLLALTHGPIPSLTEWEVVSSHVDEMGFAFAIIVVGGKRFVVRVNPAEYTIGGNDTEALEAVLDRFPECDDFESLASFIGPQ